MRQLETESEQSWQKELAFRKKEGSSQAEQADSLKQVKQLARETEQS